MSSLNGVLYNEIKDKVSLFIAATGRQPKYCIMSVSVLKNLEASTQWFIENSAIKAMDDEPAQIMGLIISVLPYGYKGHYLEISA